MKYETEILVFYNISFFTEKEKNSIIEQIEHIAYLNDEHKFKFNFIFLSSNIESLEVFNTIILKTMRKYNFKYNIYLDNHKYDDIDNGLKDKLSILDCSVNKLYIYINLTTNYNINYVDSIYKKITETAFINYKELNREIDEKNVINIASILNIDNQNYLLIKSELLIFIKTYGYDIDSLKNPKIEFRYICFSNIRYMRNLLLPNFCKNSKYESVLIEYRCFPHLEFLIRNTIIKLGNKWSHTIICGNLNYDYMVNMCSTISDKIKIIKTNYDNLEPAEYNNFLSSLDFWNLLKGEKILIYQEDSIIFKNNINDFLCFDYIGAPWPAHQNDNINGVGNGGLSLRTKSVMKKIINSIHILDTHYNSSTLEYMHHSNLNFPPEDVYFSKNMKDLNIGVLADRLSAERFSTESILNLNSFGGHNFWVCDTQWKNRIFTHNVIQFIPSFDVTYLEHRGGWLSVIKSLVHNNFFNDNSCFDFIDVIESKFLWEDRFEYSNKWTGFIHCTPKAPPYLECINISKLFDKTKFINSLKNCRMLLTLSSYVTNYLKCKLKEMDIYVEVYTLKHPVEEDGVQLFDIEEYFSNNDKAIIQIGQQLRKMSSIYLLDSLNLKKIWLTGTTNYKKCNKLLSDEIKYLNIDENNFKSDVVMKYTKTEEEYDELISKNIVFMDVFDAAANNTVVECILRNTPIITNKLDAIVEYLGEDYPLYFNSIDEIPLILSDDNKIIQAHNYLSNMNKEDLTLKYFTQQLLTLTNSNFSNI